MPPLSDDPARVSRRGFLQALGAGAASLGLSACVRPPAQKILPYSRQRPELAPGRALHYATALELGGLARGVLVTCREGRPIKVEGNPDHPASLGGSGVFEQAAIDHLYDPDRAQAFRRRGAPSASWLEFQRETFARADALARERGARLRFLVEPTASPLLLDLRARLAGRFPEARLVPCAPLPVGQDVAGARLAFGAPLVPLPDFSAARVVACLGADPLDAHPMALRHARAWAAHRDPGEEMSRLYVFEPAPTPTGTVAEHRVPATPSEIAALAWALLAEVAALPAGEPLRAIPVPPDRLPRSPEHRRLARVVAADLAAHPRQALVLAGESQPPEVHAVVLAIDSALGALDATLRLAPPALGEPVAGPEALLALADELRSGAVDTLVIAAHDPVFTAPAHFGLGAALAHAAHVVYLARYDDETAAASEWVLPATHAFETWGDARAADGMASIVQPLIAPLFGGVTEAEVLAAWLGESDAGAYALLRRYWQGRDPGDGFEARWERWLADGVVPGTQLQPATARLDARALAEAVRGLPALPAEPEAPLELNLALDRKVHDGRFANLARVQELPEPISKLTWGNAALLSPALARRLGIAGEARLRLKSGDRSLVVPALVSPGHADGCVTLHLGYGRKAPAMTVAHGVGVNASALAPGPLAVEATPKETALALAQRHFRLEDRPHARVVTLEQARGEEPHEEPLPTMFAPVPPEGHQWAMAVDLGRCTGCEACVLACAIENNVPAVGAAHVRNSRAMNWLRIDRYDVGAPDRPRIVHQPMACQHCRYAPCEYVCPVNATVHSDEGLNEQVYNRCVGTRYCSNNCPYKVRRFNFLEHQRPKAETQKMAMNPDVTVRSRGVMEKCTYCVQRIERARIDSRREGRVLGDGEVVSACAQACPTSAIVFGDLSDPGARVTRLQAEARSYAVLHELGTRPRTRYLARVENPNPTVERT